MPQLLFILFLFVNSTASFANNVFKYKDEHGKWVFSDKPPAQQQTFKKLTYQEKIPNVVSPKIYQLNKSNKYLLMVHNPFYAPIEVVIFASNNTKLSQQVIPANSHTQAIQQSKPFKNTSFKWLMGDPTITPDDFIYQLPFQSKLGLKVTQGFNGRFSHTSNGNRYAIDIAMEVGTYIRAARAGTVVKVKDDYHMGGNGDYFLDKANVVKVLHQDGTIATYAHILLSTAQVKVGDQVKTGQVLARSGSSGFSTGPHLHFVIRKNAGLKVTSVPFKFHNKQLGIFTPKQGQVLTTN